MENEKKENEQPRNNLPYLDAMHGIQSGVKVEMQYDENMASSKHLRVGIDSAMVNDAALVRLLIKKGVITLEEYHEELRLEANRELDRYEDRISDLLGKSVTLR